MLRNNRFTNQRTIASARGNALFLILIAVALFAALSYAVTNSGRGGGNSDREQTELRAAEVIQYASLVDQHLKWMRLISGYNFWELDYSCNDTRACAGATNATCTTPDCAVFTASGGDLPKPPRGVEYLDPDYVSATGNDEGLVFGLSVGNIQGVGTSEADIFISINGLSEEICNAINRQLIDVNSSPTLTYNGGGSFGSYSGTLTADPTSPRNINNTEFQNQLSFCAGFSSGADWQTYRQVVDAR